MEETILIFVTEQKQWLDDYDDDNDDTYLKTIQQSFP
jgi:hypothetical protein